MKSRHFISSPQRVFWLGLALICSIYLIFEWLFIPFSALSADEFVFARHIHEYTTGLPYRDFPPYKTVLGYYLLSLPLYFVHDVLKPLFYIKEEIALINASFFVLFGFWAARFFSKKAIILSLLLIIANQFFLVYSADLRVDMLTSWCCLIALFFILERRFYLSGISISIAFLISQKALWYLVAINSGILVCWYLKKDSAFSWRSFLKFNISAAVPLLIYILFWSLLSSPSTVLYNLFYEAFIQAGINWYLPIYLLCWQRILSHGTLLFFLWPAVFLILKNASITKINENSFFIIVAGTTALIQFMLYLQPFPYNFVFTIPAFFLLFNELLDWLFSSSHETLSQNTLTFNNVNLFLIVAVTAIYLFFIHFFALSALNYINLFLPVLLFSFLYFQTRDALLTTLSRRLILAIIFITGILYPLYHSTKISLTLSGKYQQAMIQLADSLITEKDGYVAGIPFIYDKDQSVAGLKNLIGPAIGYLYQSNTKLAPLLLPSLYLAPIDKETVTKNFSRTPPKILLNNYRMESLPDTIREYIFYHYYHYYGSIYTYAPVVFNSQLTFELQFKGHYLIHTRPHTFVEIDNKRFPAGKTIFLNAGDHLNNSFYDYRLIWQPDNKPVLSAKFADDKWKKMIKAIVV